MAAIFFLPGPLQRFAAGRDRVVIESSAGTVAEALAALWRQYPGIRDRVVTEQGQIRQHLNVFVGNEDIRHTGGLETQLADGAEITIIPAISGG